MNRLCIVSALELQSEQGWQKPIGWITVEGFETRNGWDGIKFYNAAMRIPLAPQIWQQAAYIRLHHGRPSCCHAYL